MLRHSKCFDNGPQIARAVLAHTSVNSTLPYQHYGMENIRSAIKAHDQASLAQAQGSTEKLRYMLFWGYSQTR